MTRMSAFVLLLAASLTSSAIELTATQRKELIVFGMKAAGMKVTAADVKSLTTSDVRQLVRSGINLNGHGCTHLLGLKPLKLSGRYEATCLAHREGFMRKYILDTLKGVAVEP